MSSLIEKCAKEKENERGNQEEFELKRETRVSVQSSDSEEARSQEHSSDPRHMITRADRMPSEEEEIVSFVPGQQSQCREPKAHDHRDS